jgi:hypothetical protein
MDRRTWILALVPAVAVGIAVLLIEVAPTPLGCSGAAAYVDPSYCPPRIQILWYKLSPTEVVVWSILVGGVTGALLGLLVDRMTRAIRPVQVTLSSASAGRT